MLRYKKQQWSSQIKQPWKKIDYLYCRHHLDFDKYIYKDGHKQFKGPSQYIRDLFKKEKAQFLIWRALRG